MNNRVLYHSSIGRGTAHKKKSLEALLLLLLHEQHEKKTFVEGKLSYRLLHR
jgi:hypothetical protein